jgi:hypothetical protein
MKLLIPIAIMLSLSACASQKELAMPKGEWRPLNVGKWEFNPNNLIAPPSQVARAQ